MNRSETVGELAKALALAQGKMRGAVKDSENPFFKTKYADLASVVEAIRDALSQNGIAYVQGTEPSEKDEVRVETMLLHGSGEWISSVLALPVSKSDAQGFGSALTYARRYGLSAAVGVAPEEDDGNAATKAPGTRTYTFDTTKMPLGSNIVPPPGGCPVCKQDSLRKNGKTGAWFCSKQFGGCGIGWPAGPRPTAPPADLAPPGIVSAEQAEAEAAALFPAEVIQLAESAEVLLARALGLLDSRVKSEKVRETLWYQSCPETPYRAMPPREQLLALLGSLGAK